MEANDKRLTVKKFGDKSERPCAMIYCEPLPAKNTVAIYALIDPRDGSVFYVGQTSSYLPRLRYHIRDTDLDSRRPTRSEKQRIEIVKAGHPIYASVLCVTDNSFHAEYLEMLAMRVFHKTIKNVHRIRDWNSYPRYNRGF
jgi:hypothetical protein